LPRLPIAAIEEEDGQRRQQRGGADVLRQDKEESR
jgi:hypothetical protein